MLNKIRRMLYKAASFLGDINAVRKGTIVQRLVRKQVHKKSGGWINKIFK